VSAVLQIALAETLPGEQGGVRYWSCNTLNSLVDEIRWFRRGPRSWP
jgi:hypothetical protein